MYYRILSLIQYGHGFKETSAAIVFNLIVSAIYIATLFALLKNTEWFDNKPDEKPSSKPLLKFLAFLFGGLILIHLLTYLLAPDWWFETTKLVGE